ncbi:hypothetical protein R6Q59_031067 [Mikania micrantha]
MAIPDDESDNKSKDVVEFFHAGDSAFCYSAVFFNDEKLDKRFWGTLLGYYDNGHLSSTFANGKFTPFPSFFDIDFVYFPYCFQRQNWSLLKVDLKTQELFLFDNKRTTGEEYRTQFHPALRKIAVYFTALLVTIRYWKETRRPEASITFGMNDEFINSLNALNGNEGKNVSNAQFQKLSSDSSSSSTGLSPSRDFSWFQFFFLINS